MARRESLDDWHTNIMCGDITTIHNKEAGIVELNVHVSFAAKDIFDNYTPDRLVYAAQALIEPIGSRTSDESPTFYSNILNKLRSCNAKVE